MRIYSDIDDRQSRIVVTFRERISLYDISEMLNTSRAAQVLHFQLLADVSHAAFALTDGDLTALRENLCELLEQTKLGQTAVLVGSPADLAVAEAIRVQIAGLCEMRGFMERREAERWLGWAA